MPDMTPVDSINAEDTSGGSTVSSAPVQAPAPEVPVRTARAFQDPGDGQWKIQTTTGELMPLNPKLPEHAALIQDTQSMLSVADAKRKAMMPAPVSQPEVGTMRIAEDDGRGPAPAMQQAPAGPAKGTLVPVGVESDTKVEKSMYDAKLEKSADEARKTYEESLKASVELDTKKAKQEADAIELQNLKLADAAKQHIAEQQMQASRIQEKMDAVNRISDQYASMKVDPNFFGRMDTGNKIMASVSLILGGLAQGVGGGKTNVAQDVLDKAIDRDIEAQKANILKKGNELQQARGALGEFLQVSGDMRAAENAERARIYDVTKAQLMEIAAKSNIPAVQERANQAIAELEMKSAAAKNEAHKGVITNVVKKQSQALGMSNKPITAEQSKSLSQIRSNYKLAQELHELAQDPEVQNAMGAAKGRWNQWVADQGGELPPKVAEFNRKYYDVLSRKEKGELGRFSEFGSKIEGLVLGGGLRSAPKNTVQSFKQLKDELADEYQFEQQLVMDPHAAVMQPLPKTHHGRQSSLGFKKK